jgi:hypothetical protein
MQHHLVGTLRPEARPDQNPRGLHPRPSHHVYTLLHTVPSHVLLRPFTVISRSGSHRPQPQRFRITVINCSYLHLSWRVSLAVRQPSKPQSRHISPTALPMAHALTYFRDSRAYHMSASRLVRLSARSSSDTLCFKSSPSVISTAKCLL